MAMKKITAEIDDDFLDVIAKEAWRNGVNSERMLVKLAMIGMEHKRLCKENQ